MLWLLFGQVLGKFGIFFSTIWSHWFVYRMRGGAHASLSLSSYFCPLPLYFTHSLSPLSLSLSHSLTHSLTHLLTPSVAIAYLLRPPPPSPVGFGAIILEETRKKKINSGRTKGKVVFLIAQNYRRRKWTFVRGFEPAACTKTKLEIWFCSPVHNLCKSIEIRPLKKFPFRQLFVFQTRLFFHTLPQFRREASIRFLDWALELTSVGQWFCESEWTSVVCGAQQKFCQFLNTLVTASRHLWQRSWFLISKIDAALKKHFHSNKKEKKWFSL